MPESFAETATGVLLIANGVNEMLRWDGLSANAEAAGIAAPAAAPTLGQSGVGAITGSYTAYLRFVDAKGNFSNLSPVSAAFAATNAAAITYSGVQAPGEAKVARRQILRNTSGQASVYYVDVDTTDLTGVSFTSTRADAELRLQAAQSILDADGNVLANRYTVPPAHKAVLAQHLERMFAAVDVPYTAGSVQVATGSTTAQGVGTEWPGTFAGRQLFVAGGDQAYLITAVDAANQTLTLSAPYTGATDLFAAYAVRPALAEGRLVYYSEAGLPEAWPATNAISLQEDGDEITGLMTKGSFLYVLERHHVYRFTFQTDPAKDGFAFLSINRGCVNNRCWVLVRDVAYLLDEAGVHSFGGGQESQPLSGPIQDVFQVNGGGPFKINWAASDLFHAAYFPDEEILRWFVCLSGSYLPQHALCYNYRDGWWWIEHYPWPVGASTRGDPGRARRTYVGGPAGRVFAFSGNDLDGADPDAGTTRNSVTSAGPVTLTDGLASFAASRLAGSPVSIVAGRGKGQTNTIAAVSGTTVTLKNPWRVRPDATSVYQLGGIGWRYKTKIFRLVEDAGNDPRRVELVFQPCAHPATLDLRRYDNHDAAPQTWARTRDGSADNGWAAAAGGADLVLDLTRVSGFAEKRMDARRDSYIEGTRFMQFELRGYTNRDGTTVYQIAIDGVGAR